MLRQSITSLQNYIRNYIKDKAQAQMIGLLLLIIIGYTIAFWELELPFSKAGFDTYSHIGILKAISMQFESISSDYQEFFPYLFKTDLHIGVNFIFMFLVAKLFGEIGAIFVMGVVNLVLVINGLFYFAKIYLKKTSLALASLLILLALAPTSGVGTGLFSIVDLIVIAHYPAVFAFGLTTILLALNMKYYQTPTKKLFFAQLILFFCIFVSHILTSFIYLIIFLIFITTISIKTRNTRFGKESTKNDMFSLTLLFGFFALMLFTIFAWPFYNSLDALMLSNPIQQGEPPSVYNFNFPMGILRLYDIGILLLTFAIYYSIRNKDYFLTAWLVIFLIISFSYLLPFRPPLYWRFVPFLKIPIVFAFVDGVLGVSRHHKKNRVDNKSKIKKSLSHVFYTSIAVALIIILLVSATSILPPLMQHESMIKRYSFLSNYDQNSGVILAYDPFDAYDVQALTNFSVLSIPPEHVSDVRLHKLILERDELINRIFMSNDIQDWISTISEFNITYVLIPKHNKNINVSQICELLTSHGAEIDFSNGSYILISVANLNNHFFES